MTMDECGLYFPSDDTVCDKPRGHDEGVHEASALQGLDLRAALMGLRRHDLDDGPCWCSTEPSAVNAWRHVEACRNARAALAGKEGKE